MSDSEVSPDFVPNLEYSVVGGCILDAEAATYALDRVRPEHFEDFQCRHLLKAVQLVASEGGRADVLRVAETLKEIGDYGPEDDALLRAVMEATPTAANQRYYVGHLLRRWLVRVEHETATRIASNGLGQADIDALKARAQRAKEEVEAKLRPATKALPSSWDFADMAAEGDDPPPDEFVSRLFVRPSFNMVFGPPQAGKSWAVMALCLDAVMGGGSFLGCEELYVTPLREIRDGRREVCLWVFGGEDTRARVKRRLKTLLASGPHAGKDVPKGAFVVATPPGGTSLHMPEGWAWLVAKVKETGATLVVLDTIASLTGSTLDVKKDEQVVPFVAKVNALRDELKLVVFGLHHTRKGSSDAKKGSESKADAMLGSQAWRALSEGVLMLDAPDGDTSKVVVVSVKAKDVERPMPRITVTLESPGGRFRQLDDDEAPAEREPVRKTGRRPSVTPEMIVALRQRHPDGVAWKDVPGILGVPEGTWRNNSTSLQDALLKLDHVVVQGLLKWARA